MAAVIAVKKGDNISGYYLADDQDLVSRVCDAKIYASFADAADDMVVIELEWSLAEGERFEVVDDITPRSTSTNWE